MASLGDFQFDPFTGERVDGKSKPSLGMTNQSPQFAISPSATVRTQEWTPPGEMPTMPDIPEFELPEYDEEEITRLTQKRAAPGMRKLGESARAAMSRPYQSAQIQRMSLSQALEGYGMGLESIMGGAGQQATSEYGQKYGREAQAEQMNWQAQTQRLRDIYASTMEDYYKRGTTEARQFYEYEDEKDKGFSWDELFEERGIKRG